jgi:hypothetical protein
LRNVGTFESTELIKPELQAPAPFVRSVETGEAAASCGDSASGDVVEVAIVSSRLYELDPSNKTESPF